MGVKRILYRVEGNDKIGMGHLMRTIALSEAMPKDEFNLIFILSSYCKEFCSVYLSNNDIEAVYIKVDTVGSYEDAQLTKTFITENQIDFLIIDGYEFKESFQKILFESGVKSMVFDDNNYCKLFYTNVVLNQNFHTEPKNYIGVENCLIGSSFVILRDEFLNFDKTIVRGEKSILISLGGSDKNNYTLLVLRSLAKLDILKSYKLHIVLGNANKNSSTIHSFCKEIFNGYSYKVHHPSNQMAKLIEQSDYCISAGGTSVFEIFYMNKPAIFLVIADNQVPNCNWIKDNTSYPVIYLNESVSMDLKIPFEELMKRDVSSSYDLVDGKGKHRIVENINTFLLS